jgi:hypothetical protein
MTEKNNLYKSMMSRVKPDSSLVRATRLMMDEKNSAPQKTTYVTRQFMPMMATLLLLVGSAAGVGVWLNANADDYRVEVVSPGREGRAALAGTQTRPRDDTPGIIGVTPIAPNHFTQPAELTPLSQDEIDTIRFAYAAHVYDYFGVRNNNIFDDILANVSIVSYLGTYDGHHVVIMSRSQVQTYDYVIQYVEGLPIVQGSGSWELLVNVDVKPDENGIYPAYSVRQFVTLQEAFDEELLTMQDIHAISYHSGGSNIDREQPVDRERRPPVDVDLPVVTSAESGIISGTPIAPPVASNDFSGTPLAPEDFSGTPLASNDCSRQRRTELE